MRGFVRSVGVREERSREGKRNGRGKRGRKEERRKEEGGRTIELLGAATAGGVTACPCAKV